MLSFFDTAGEDLNDQTSVDQNIRYLTSADGVILLLDPLQMRGARPLAARGQPAGSGADTGVTGQRTEPDHGPAPPSAKTPGGADRHPDRRGVLQDGHAVAALGEGSPLRTAPAATSRFHDRTVCRARHMQALLHEWRAATSTRPCAADYRGTASSACPPSGGARGGRRPCNRVSGHGVQPGGSRIRCYGC